MIQDRYEEHQGARFLVVLASGVVVTWGLQFAAPILLPTAVALFLAVLTFPLVNLLRSRRVPPAAAIILSVVMVVGGFSLLIFGASRALGELETSLPRYWNRLREVQQSWIQGLTDRFGLLNDGTGQAELFGRPLEEYLPLNLIEPGGLLEFVSGTVQLGASLVTQSALVVLIMAFILSEMTVLPGKLEAILGDGIKGEERLQKVIREVQEYLGIKTVISLMTGIAIGLWAWVMGLDFPVLLGLVGFVLNYIPTVGSILASIPGIILSLILFGTLGHALVVAFGYFAVNTVFGSILEPNLLGRRLGLSTLVVILSLLFWGWTWGPIGALLSVPLTMVVKIFFENTPDLRWVAVLLDKQAPEDSSDGATPTPDPATPGSVPTSQVSASASSPPTPLPR
ncbi:MAG: AI-2E family transporter [Gemmatimonadota bacterium]